MKVKRFRCPLLLAASLAQARTLLRGFAALVADRKLLSALLFSVVLALGSCLWPYDRTLLEKLHFWSPGQEAIASQIAWYLSTWGDYLTYNVPLALLIWIYGVRVKSSAWRRIALVCFLGATFAGLFDDCLRLTLGRPRPDADLPDHFYGICYAFQGKYQSFPSGHSAAVFGAASALLIVHRALGLLTGAFALAVVWARMEIYRHYPSDVFVGSCIGLYFGLMVGFGSQLRQTRARLTVEKIGPPEPALDGCLGVFFFRKTPQANSPDKRCFEDREAAFERLPSTEPAIPTTLPRCSSA